MQFLSPFFALMLHAQFTTAVAVQLQPACPSQICDGLLLLIVYLILLHNPLCAVCGWCHGVYTR